MRVIKKFLFIFIPVCISSVCYGQRSESEAYHVLSTWAIDSMIKSNEILNDHKYATIEQKLVNTPQFKQLFSSALSEALAKGYTNEEMEDYVEHFGNISDALTLKRGRHLFVTCGNDNTARYHLYNILRLSYKTLNRGAFLHAYLNFFDNDESFYPKYISLNGLEQLNLDISNLLFGTLLNTENWSGTNHYWPYSWSSFRFYAIEDNISEAKNSELLMKQMIEMVKDKELDLYNRVLLCKIYMACIERMTDKGKKMQNTLILKKAIATLPVYYAKQIKIPKV